MNLTSTSDVRTGKVAKTSAYKVHELPPVPLPSVNIKENQCLKTGSVFNPSNIQEDQGMRESNFHMYIKLAFLQFMKSCVVYTFCL
jgi:hypothetical protein